MFENPALTISALVFWGIVIVVCLIVEAETSNLVSIWFGVAAIPTLVCAWFEVHVAVQIFVFAIVSLALVLLTRPLVKKFNVKNTVHTNADRLVGMVGKVTKAIPEEGKGEVKINFQLWSAITEEKNTIQEGESVVVKEIVGNKLLVETIKEIEVK